jgi:hypothetical protein
MIIHELERRTSMGDFFKGYETGWRSCLKVMVEEWPHLSERMDDCDSIIEQTEKRMKSISELLVELN